MTAPEEIHLGRTGRLPWQIEMEIRLYGVGPVPIKENPYAAPVQAPRLDDEGRPLF